MSTIQIKAIPNHLATGRIKSKLQSAFEKSGHIVSDENPDIMLILGEAGDWTDDQKVKCKKVLWNHGVWIRPRCPVLEIPQNQKINEIYKNVDTVAYHSEFARNATWKYLEKRDGPVIFNSSESKLENWVPGDLSEIRLVTCAIPRPLKRFDEMLRLTEVLKDKGYPATLTLMGNDRFWSDEEQNAEYSKAHVALHFGFNDYSPATVGEAMAYGIPHIFTNSGGAKEMIGGAGEMLKVDKDDYEDFNDYPKIPDEIFIKAFEKIIKNYPEYVEKTRKRVTEVMNIDKTAEQFIKVFEEVLSK